MGECTTCVIRKDQDEQRDEPKSNTNRGMDRAERIARGIALSNPSTRREAAKFLRSRIEGILKVDKIIS